MQGLAPSTSRVALTNALPSFLLTPVLFGNTPYCYAQGPRTIARVSFFLFFFFMGACPHKRKAGWVSAALGKIQGGARLFLDSVSPKILLLPVSRSHPVPPSSNLNLHTTNSFPSNCLQMPTLPSLPTTVASSTPDFVERIGLCPASISI